jgi:hypothetical protein
MTLCTQYAHLSPREMKRKRDLAAAATIAAQLTMKLDVGHRVEVRDSADQDWQPGEVIIILEGGRPGVRRDKDGSVGRPFTWKEVRRPKIEIE